MCCFSPITRGRKLYLIYLDGGTIKKRVQAIAMIQQTTSFQAVDQLGGASVDGRWWLMVLDEVEELRSGAHTRASLVIGLRHVHDQ